MSFSIGIKLYTWPLKTSPYRVVTLTAAVQCQSNCDIFLGTIGWFFFPHLCIDKLKKKKRIWLSRHIFLLPGEEKLIEPCWLAGAYQLSRNDWWCGSHLNTESQKSWHPSLIVYRYLLFLVVSHHTNAIITAQLSPNRMYSIMTVAVGRFPQRKNQPYYTELAVKETRAYRRKRERAVLTFQFKTNSKSCFSFVFWVMVVVVLVFTDGQSNYPHPAATMYQSMGNLPAWKVAGNVRLHQALWHG